MPARPYLALEEFAELIGLPVQAVRELTEAGLLDGVRTDDGQLFAVFTDRLLDADQRERVAAASAEAEQERASIDASGGTDGWSMSW